MINSDIELLMMDKQSLIRLYKETKKDLDSANEEIRRLNNLLVSYSVKQLAVDNNNRNDNNNWELMGR